MQKAPASVLAAAAVAAGALLPGALAHASAMRTVTIEDVDFHPAHLSVARGTTVRWRFADGSVEHNVHSVGARRFASSPTKAHGTYAVTFRHAGSYRYVCTIHPNMVGRVTVR